MENLDDRVNLSKIYSTEFARGHLVAKDSNRTYGYILRD